MASSPGADRLFGELQNAAGFFRLLVEAMSDFVTIVDRDHKLRYINHLASGYALEDVIGTSVYDYTEPKYHHEMRQALQHVLETAEPTRLVTEAAGDEGQIVWYETTLSPLLDGGEVIAVSLIAKNITDETLAEDRLARERRLLLGSLDVSEGAVVVLDTDGHIAIVNRIGASLLGAEPEALIGEPWVERFVPPGGRKDALLELRRLLDGEMETAHSKSEVVSADGTKRSIAWHNAVIRDDEGQIEAIVGFGEDISDLGVPREERLERESLLSSIFAATPIGVGFVKDRVFTRVNESFCSLIGYSQEELIGRKSRIMYSSEAEYERVGEVVYGQIERGDPGVVLAKLKRKDGTLLDAQITGAPLRGDTADSGITFTVQDMTERLRMERELRDSHDKLEAEVAARTDELVQVNEELMAANSAKNQFLAAMSHELRTPLNSVIGFTGIMLDGLAGEITEEQHKQLEMVRGAGDKLLALVNDILDLAKIEEDRIEIAPTDFTIGEVAEESADLLRLGARHKGLALEVKIDDPDLVLHTDYRAVEQILVNLLSNAVKYTDEGSVTLAAHLAGDSVKITVKDTGCGIEPSATTRIFEAFHRAGDPTSRGPGTGLGLAISSRLADRLGGSLNVDSTVGVGSTFTLEIPIVCAG